MMATLSPRQSGAARLFTRAATRAACSSRSCCSARAARASEDYDDALEWTSLADYLRGHPAQIELALADALPGPVGRAALPGPVGRRMLAPPRGDRNARTRCGCHDGDCSIHS